eukprot:Awhi_evm1s7558
MAWINRKEDTSLFTGPRVFLPKGESYRLPLTSYPFDENDPDFSQSFTVEEVTSSASNQNARDFFLEHGWLVVRNVFTPYECEESRNAFWGLFESNFPSFKRDDPTSWDSWPTNRHGMIGEGNEPTLDPVFLRCRQNERLRQCFAAVYGSDDLLCNHDRILMTRPTRDIPFMKNGHICMEDRPEWFIEKDSSKNPGLLHLDMNPWYYYDKKSSDEILNGLSFENASDHIKENNIVNEDMGLTLQGLINFGECPSDNGGTRLVSGFHRIFDQYMKKLIETEKFCSMTQYRFDKVTKLNNHAVSVPQHE